MKKVQKYIIEHVRGLIGGKVGEMNATIYSNLFKSMNDKQFIEWYKTYLSKDTDVLNVIIPNGVENTINVEKIQKYILKHFNYDFFRPLVYKEGKKKLESIVETYTLLLNVRIPAQTVDKGIAVTKGKVPNILTGQVNSASKITPPETGILYGLGMTSTLRELHKFRGGDEGLKSAFENSLMSRGEATMNELDEHATGVTSTTTLDTYFKGMHIKLFHDDDI